MKSGAFNPKCNSKLTHTMPEQQHPTSPPFSPDKAALLEKIAPLFPYAEDTGKEHFDLDTRDPAELARREHARYERLMLPYWQALAPAYAAALAQPFGNDGSVLKTSVGYWPDTAANQQALLHELLTTSQLRRSWQQHCRFEQQRLANYGSDPGDEQHQSSAVKQQTLEAAMHAGDAPLKEIPLYHGWLRVSCQQLVCLPKAQWQALSNDGAQYNPSQINAQTVERLATRIAQVFNRPPLLHAEQLQNGPSCQDATVWQCSQHMLTLTTVSQHGMRDRLVCEKDWPAEDAATISLPEWRYMGFCGQIDVTLEDGASWVVCVLAPIHFVRHLMRFPYW